MISFDVCSGGAASISVDPESSVHHLKQGAATTSTAWEMFHDASGIPFYYQRSSGRSVWELPTAGDD